MRRRSGEADQAHHGTEKGNHVDRFFRVADFRESAVERQDDQERRECLRSRQQHPQLAQ